MSASVAGYEWWVPLIALAFGAGSVFFFFFLRKLCTTRRYQSSLVPGIWVRLLPLFCPPPYPVPTPMAVTAAVFRIGSATSHLEGMDSQG